MGSVAKVIALVLLAALAFVANAYASLYFAGYMFPRIEPRPYVEMVGAAVAGGVAAAVVTAWPLARLYADRAWLAALVVAAPVVALRVGDLLHYGQLEEPRIIAMSLVELLLYPALILGGVWVASHLRTGKPNAA